ncbi:MAG TPA: hypothetical protein VFP80_02810 [Thermoanaerobaculia bacterium]|nr:hypothetical protein [Thermoanaerobaculia bacterium]
MARSIRKHRTALIALAVLNFVFFFPVAFMGRVVSPNDVFANFSPWNLGRPLDVTRAQNSLINDPPTAYFTLLALAKSDPRTFHWNPYIASGVPGFGSSAAATLTPFALLPLLVPLTWLYTAMAFLKLNAAFVFAYLWLREERLGARGAAIGAIIFAGAGMYSVRWLWQITNTTVLYPALLWIVCRTFHGRRTPVIVTTLIALAYAISGFPAAIAYGAWVCILYSAYRLGAPAAGRPVPRPLAGPAGRRWTGRLAAGAPFLTAAVAVLIAFLIALPTLVPFIQLIRRTGYLEGRQTTALTAVYPLRHAQSFFQPDRLGNPAYKNWTGDPVLGVQNNYVEATVYLGLLAFPLALLGIFNRRARARWFWLGAALLILACMFGVPWISDAVAKVPGFKYSALARLGLILPLPIAYLAAAARLRKQLVYDGVAILVAFDLALFAGRFHPYLTPTQAHVATTPTIAFLQAEKQPFRVAPMMDYLWPNSAELVRVEDVRSHFSSEAEYRKLMQRLEPGAWGGRSTLITFFSPNFHFDDPLTGLLGIRWYIEHKYIDIIKWGIFKATVPGVKETGTIMLKSGMTLQRDIRVDAEPFWSIELPVNVDGGSGRLEVTLLKNGAPVWSRAFTKDEANVMNKIYVPLRPHARLGETVSLRIRANGVQGYVLQAEGPRSFFYGRVTTPIYFDRELPEGRLFRNLAELPRFRAVSRLRKLNDAEFLAARDVDFATEAVITDDPVQAPVLSPSNVAVALTHYAPNEQRVLTSSDAAFYLASSEKLTPELAVTIDGRAVRPIETDMLFAGVPVPPGRHEVVFSRRLGRGWWWAAGVGVGLLALASVLDRRRLGG